MKSYRKLLFILVSTLLVLWCESCSVIKRHYRPGYFWNSVSHRSTENPKQTESQLTDLDSTITPIDYPTKQSCALTEPEYSENELQVLHSSPDSLYVERTFDTLVLDQSNYPDPPGEQPTKPRKSCEWIWPFVATLLLSLCILAAYSGIQGSDFFIGLTILLAVAAIVIGFIRIAKERKRRHVSGEKPTMGHSVLVVTALVLNVLNAIVAGTILFIIGLILGWAFA